MTPIIQHFASRAEWLAARRNSLGGSDAATLCGYGYASEYELWADKIASAGPEDAEVPEYVEAGQFMEPALIAWWQHRTELIATPTPLTIIRNPALPWAHCSPDALVGDDAGLDAKNVDRRRAEELDAGLPLDWQVQGQHYIAVTGRARWHFAPCIGGNQLRPHTVERDDSFIDTLMTMERQWWDRHVVGKSPPEPDGSEGTRRAIYRLFPRESEGEVRALDVTFLALRDTLDAARAERKLADAEIVKLENKIKAALGDATYGVMPDGSRWKWCVEPRKSYVVQASEPRVLRFEKAEKNR